MILDQMLAHNMHEFSRVSCGTKIINIIMSIIMQSLINVLQRKMSYYE